MGVGAVWLYFSTWTIHNRTVLIQKHSLPPHPKLREGKRALVYNLISFKTDTKTINENKNQKLTFLNDLKICFMCRQDLICEKAVRITSVKMSILAARNVSWNNNIWFCVIYSFYLLDRFAFNNFILIFQNVSS